MLYLLFLFNSFFIFFIFSVRFFVHRLAELLDIPQLRQTEIIAQEAAGCGQFKIALILAKELYDKYPEAKTGAILKSISFELTKYAHEHPEIFESQKNISVSINGKKNI